MENKKRKSRIECKKNHPHLRNSENRQNQNHSRDTVLLEAQFGEILGNHLIQLPSKKTILFYFVAVI